MFHLLPRQCGERDILSTDMKIITLTKVFIIASFLRHLRVPSFYETETVEGNVQQLLSINRWDRGHTVSLLSRWTLLLVTFSESPCLVGS